MTMTPISHAGTKPRSSRFAATDGMAGGNEGGRIRWFISSAPGHPLVIQTLEEDRYSDYVTGGIALDLEQLERLKLDIDMLIAIKKVADSTDDLERVPPVTIERKDGSVLLEQKGIKGLILTPYQILDLRLRLSEIEDEKTL